MFDGSEICQCRCLGSLERGPGEENWRIKISKEPKIYSSERVARFLSSIFGPDCTDWLQHAVHVPGVPVAAKTTHVSTFNTRNVAAHGYEMIGRI